MLVSRNSRVVQIFEIIDHRFLVAFRIVSNREAIGLGLGLELGSSSRFVRVWVKDSRFLQLTWYQQCVYTQHFCWLQHVFRPRTSYYMQLTLTCSTSLRGSVQTLTPWRLLPTGHNSTPVANGMFTGSQTESSCYRAWSDTRFDSPR